jgi:tetratricopeptide (TPR) repeat protein
MSTCSPFVGSRPFDTADEPIFHGRTREAVALARLWRDRRLTILHGPAGVGKTSLLRAGVLPALGAGAGSRVLPVGRLAFLADFPLAAFPDINPFTVALLASWYPEDSPTRIAGSSIRGLIRKNSGVDRHGNAVPVLAAIDQADLLFFGTHQRDGHRRRFAYELVEATTARPDLHLIIAVRTENLEELQTLLTRAGMPDRHLTRFPLGAFSPATAREAVSGPLGRTCHPLAAHADRLVEELGTGETAIDPALLQIVCSRLWDELPLEGLDRVPTAVDRILGEHCLRALATVAADHGESPSKITGWYRQVFGRRSEPDGVPEGRRTTRDLPNSVVRAFEDVRLLRADRHSGRRRYHLRQARLRPVVRRLDPGAAASARRDRPRLDAAEAAFTADDLDLARHLATAVAGEAEADGPVRAAAECLLGTIAYSEGRMSLAAEHYEAAIIAFGALGDTTHVGMLVAAVGRLKIGSHTTEAVSRLRAALTQLPGDTFVKTALAQALWYAGRTQAAIAILDDALNQNGATPEAIRLRGELLADLNRAEPALRDLDRVDHGDRPSSRAAWALAKKTYEGAGSPATKELELVDDADDSGPVLLRVARVLRLEGDADTAAGLAERAVRARRPPLPQHLHKEAERLMAR